MAPGQIGAMTVRNRVVMSPMETMYGTPDGLPSQRTRDYFAARAREAKAHDREGWLALMADDVVIEDPIGKSVTKPDGTGVRGKDAVGTFFDTNICAGTGTST